jgi:hypothetical protein
MATCEVCGNEYDKTFEICRGGEAHIFDGFSARSMRSRRSASTAAAG